MPRPVLDITVGSGANPGTAWSVNIHQSEFGIDVAELIVPRIAVQNPDFRKGNPVSIVFGRTRASTTLWPGFVHHTESHRDPNSASARVVCIGAGADKLRSAARRLWPVGSSSHVAVQAIADELHLSSLSEASNVPAPGGPVNESWMAYLLRAAKVCGFTCYLNGTDIRFHSRRVDISGIPTPWFANYQDHRTQGWSVIHSFDVNESDEMGGVHRQRQSYGVSDSGQAIRAIDSGDLSNAAGLSQELPTLMRNEDIVAHDMGTAQLRLTAMQEQQRFSYQSKFIVSGDERIHQAASFVARGIDPRADGYWYALEVTHRLSSAAYSMQIKAGRDALGDTAPADLTAAAPVITLGQANPVPAPAAVLTQRATTMNDLIFPSARNTTWTAKRLLARTHIAGRANA